MSDGLGFWRKDVLLNLSADKQREGTVYPSSAPPCKVKTYSCLSDLIDDDDITSHLDAYGSIMQSCLGQIVSGCETASLSVPPGLYIGG
jgi:hypothetical protein